MLSELPLPEPLRSPISPCDFLWAYFPYHNSAWLFHACNVVCLKGKASCPLNPFPSSSSCPCLPAHHWPHKISLEVPLSPGTAPLLSLSGVCGVFCLYWNQFSMEEIKDYPYPAWGTANPWLKACFAFRWSAFKMCVAPINSFPKCPVQVPGSSLLWLWWEAHSNNHHKLLWQC